MGTSNIDPAKSMSKSRWDHALSLAKLYRTAAKAKMVTAAVSCQASARTDEGELVPGARANVVVTTPVTYSPPPSADRNRNTAPKYVASVAPRASALFHERTRSPVTIAIPTTI